MTSPIERGARLTPFVLIFGTFLLIGACNTIEGAGEDVESLGEGISDTADDAAN
jgi:predicted small secreted protein